MYSHAPLPDQSPCSRLCKPTCADTAALPPLFHSSSHQPFQFSQGPNQSKTIPRYPTEKPESRHPSLRFITCRAATDLGQVDLALWILFPTSISPERLIFPGAAHIVARPSSSSVTSRFPHSYHQYQAIFTPSCQSCSLAFAYDVVLCMVWFGLV